MRTARRLSGHALRASLLAACCAAGRFISWGSMIGAFGGTGLAQGQGPCLNWGSGFGVGLPVGNVTAMIVHDDGTGSALYIGDDTLELVNTWNGLTWTPRPGLSISSSDGYVTAFGIYDSGSGPELYASGYFTHANGQSANRIAKWNGSVWAALNPGLGNGLWSSISYSDSAANAMIPFDDGSGLSLFVGGSFELAWNNAGTIAVSSKGILRWDGTDWHGLAGGVGGIGSPYPHVTGLAVFDDGTGPALYAAGSFTTAGGVPASNIAKWSGSAWSPLGSGLNGFVRAMLAFDDGSGPSLYVAGGFTQAGGIPSVGIARWNGANWSPVGSNMGAAGYGMTILDDGSGRALYVATAEVTRWDGNAWSTLGAGVGGAGYRLCAYDDGMGGGPDLYITGNFQTAGYNVPSHYIAKWHGCQQPIAPICYGDGTLQACPCNNLGGSGRGCENSSGTGGALLTSSGTTIPDTFVLTSSGEVATSLTIFLQGDALVPVPTSFGDGIRCAGGTLRRMYLKSAVNGNAQAPGAGDPTLSQRSASFGDLLFPGSIRYYQAYYRDGSTGFCPAPNGGSFNTSSALRVIW